MPGRERVPPRVHFPDELAVVRELELRPSARFLLEATIVDAGPDGKSWRSTVHHAERIPRRGFVRLNPSDVERPRRTYSPITLRVEARRLHAAGLLDWTIVHPWGRFPSRTPGKAGKWTPHGGRIWQPNLARLREIAGLPIRRPLRQRTKREIEAAQEQRGKDIVPSVAASPAPPPQASEHERAAAHEQAIETLRRDIGLDVRRPKPPGSS